MQSLMLLWARTLDLGLPLALLMVENSAQFMVKVTDRDYLIAQRGVSHISSPKA